MIMELEMKPKTGQGSRINFMKIGPFAKMLRVTPRTVRYYESLGLVRPCGRTEGGFRLYSRDEAELLLSIMTFKDLGLSLEDIGRVTEKAKGPRRASLMFQDFLTVLENCENEIEQRLSRLSLARKEVGRARALLEECDGCDGKMFDAECVDCWKDNGRIPQPLTMLSQMAGNGGSGKADSRKDGSK
jgi:DNA-binding transcriptional MerR regulator